MVCATRGMVVGRESKSNGIPPPLWLTPSTPPFPLTLGKMVWLPKMFIPAKTLMQAKINIFGSGRSCPPKLLFSPTAPTSLYKTVFRGVMVCRRAVLWPHVVVLVDWWLPHHGGVGGWLSSSSTASPALRSIYYPLQAIHLQLQLLQLRMLVCAKLIPAWCQACAVIYGRANVGVLVQVHWC